jgi:uncharacterized protein (TIGR03000 family)
LLEQFDDRIALAEASMMFKRGFILAAGGALALLLAAADACPAQVFFGPRGGVAFSPGISYPIGPTYFPNYYQPVPTYVPPTSITSIAPYSQTPPTPIYYGSAPFMPSYPSASYPTNRTISPAPGLGLSGNSSVTAAAYSTPIYPIQTPSYNAIYPVSPPISAITDNTARVEVRIPADAELWFEGRKTALTGADRFFRSPELQAGQDYIYDVQAHWVADGKAVDQTRKVTVHAGDRVVVDFTR